MAEGYLLPSLRYTVLSTTGVPVSGAKVYAYAAGTTTKINTYTTAALSVANANPIIADSAGRILAFLTPGVAYDFVVNDASDVLMYSTLNVIGSGLGSASSRTVVGGRITGVSGSAVADTTATTSIYYTPYLGNQIGLYDGTSWTLVTFTETALALGIDTASTVYDLFVWSNSGTLALERLAWASATARATALTTQDGILVKSGDPTRRYRGTYRTTAAPGTTADSPRQRLIWNNENRVARPMRVLEATDSWTYQTATYRQANGSTTNQVELVQGIAECAVSLSLTVIVSNTAANVSTIVAIGEDATTGPATGSVGFLMDSQVAPLRYQVSARLDKSPAIGYHFYPWLEYSSAVGTTTWLGDGGAAPLIQSGMTGMWEGYCGDD